MNNADSSNRYSVIESVYQRAVELPRERRTAFLRSECGGDLALLEQVESLLHHWDAAPREYLESPVHGLPAPAAVPDLLPERIGQYAIIRMLGRGGMGSVYEAQQRQPNRRVALKVIRADVLSSETLRRFQHEAEVLGQLRHPGIAQIYEFGTGEVWFSGAPAGRQQFFAMELVQGCPLVEYAAARKLDRVAALELIASVCDALQHAHQKGVIHRDLKPSNILVDEDGRPRVLDFGVARVLQSDARDDSTHTSAGQLIGTIAYMSPEQLGGQAHAADIRSDVYSLGVVAYELLTGRLPFDVSGLSTPQIIRVLAERDPTPAGAVRRELRGDVQAILAKALERDPERRYGSAADLAADFRRYLRHEPISARPANAAYHFRKFVRRHRALVAAAAAVLIVAVGAAVWITAAMIQAQRATVRATAINDFLRDVLAEADPATGRADVRLVEVLRAAADQAAARFADSPEFEADIRVTLARAFSNLSLLDEALTHAERAQALLRESSGESHPATLSAAGLISNVLKRANRYDEARQWAEYVLALTPADQQRGANAIGARRTVAFHHSVRGDLDQAEAGLRETLRDSRVALGEQHPVTLASTNDLGWFLYTRVIRRLSDDPPRDLKESAALLEPALAAHEAVHGQTGYPTLNLLSNLSQVLVAVGRSEQAIAYAERILAAVPQRYGDDHSFCLQARASLIGACHAQRRFADAARHAIANVDTARRRASTGDLVFLLCEMSDALHILDSADRLAEGEDYARFLLDQFAGVSGHDPAVLLRYRIYLARFLSRQGRLDEAEPLFGELRSMKIADPPNRAFFEMALGAHQSQGGHFADAERALLTAHAKMLDPNEQLVPVMQDLVRLYEAWDRPEEAAVWRARVETPVTYKSWPAEPRTATAADGGGS